MKIGTSISNAVQILKRGGIVIYPTETCYGVGVDATNSDAVRKLLEYKKRPEGKAISIAVNSKEMAEKYVELNDEAKELYMQFLPGPVTVISKSKHKAAKELEAEDGTLGVRIPDFQITMSLINNLGLPITATSANSSGKKTPYKIQDILENISNKQKKLIDYILDVGELPHNPPSTVVNTTRHDMQIIRRGKLNLGLPKFEIQIKSEKEMVEQGKLLIKRYKNILENNCMLILFNAELGAGKTQFTKGLAGGLGIKEIVKSPTYSIIKEYPYVLPLSSGSLVHFDAWRLESIEELDELGIDTFIKNGNVIAVEWAGATEKFFKKFINKKNIFVIQIQINYINAETRKLIIYEAN